MTIWRNFGAPTSTFASCSPCKVKHVSRSVAVALRTAVKPEKTVLQRRLNKADSQDVSPDTGFTSANFAALRTFCVRGATGQDAFGKLVRRSVTMPSAPSQLGS